MKYKIVGDSSCDTTKEMEAKCNISIAPLTFTLDGVEYVDDDTLDLDDYLCKMAESKNVPKSACPSIHEYLQLFEDGDHDCVFGVTLSSELSGSYNSAMNAKEMYLENNPDKKCHIFDSKGASSMEVLIALKVSELCEEGVEFESVVEQVEAFIEEAKVLFVLDKIDTLEKNGRMSYVKARLVKALNLKLILMAAQDGNIDLNDKARGTKKALKKMVENMPKVGTLSADKRIAISHVNALDRAEYVKSLIEGLYEFKEIIIISTKGLSSTYANEGGIILSF